MSGGDADRIRTRLREALERQARASWAQDWQRELALDDEIDELTAQLGRLSTDDISTAPE